MTPLKFHGEALPHDLPFSLTVSRMECLGCSWESESESLYTIFPEADLQQFSLFSLSLQLSCAYIKQREKLIFHGMMACRLLQHFSVSFSQC
jgi:hypothetical protein